MIGLRKIREELPMKVINGILKFFALFLLLFFIITLPVALLVRNTGEMFFSPKAIVDLLKENILDSEVMANIAEEAIKGAEPVSTATEENPEENPFSELFMTGMQGLNHEEWVEVIELIAPPELISNTFEQVLRGYYDWIEGSNQSIKIIIDFNPWKSNTETNAVPVLKIILASLPICTKTEDVEAYNNFYQTGEVSGSVPHCRPTANTYNWLLDESYTIVPAVIEQIPDQVDLWEEISTSGDELGKTRNALLKLKVGMRSAWIFPLIAFILAVPMASRSISDIFKWGGWPLLIMGVWALLVALLLLFFSESIFAGLGRLIFTDMPSTLLIPVEAIISSILSFLAKPLLFQSAFLIVLGGGALFLGVMFSGDTVKQDSLASPAPAFDRPVEKPKPVSQPIKPEPEPKPSPKKDPDGEEDDDDSRPTGMFG